jgi:hypothetical protein
VAATTSVLPPVGGCANDRLKFRSGISKNGADVPDRSNFRRGVSWIAAPPRLGGPNYSSVNKLHKDSA